MSNKKKPNYNDGTTMNTRAYSFDICIYEIEKDLLQTKLNDLVNRGIVRHYSYIIHTHDIEPVYKKEKYTDEDGKTKTREIDTGETKPKAPHAHLLVVFNQNVSMNNIQKRLLAYTEHNMFGQPLKDKRGAYRYLTHKDNPEKYQYNDNEIVNYDDYFLKEDITINQDREYQEINQMIDDYGVLTYRQLACKYGKDFIKNFKAYQFYFELIKNEENNINREKKENEN